MRPNIYYTDPAVTIWHGDSIETMRLLPDNSIDSIVTDPPYGLGFMGKAWDALPPGEEWAAECLRVLKPGGHLLAFGGSRTWHRLAVAVEDAGFEIRDSIAWLYGSGFPKSLDVSKAIDKAAGAEREIIGTKAGHGGSSVLSRAKQMREGYRPEGEAYGEYDGTGLAPITAPATESAQQWQGWGTALKPAFEPIVMGRKPLVGTVAANVLEHGTGALNIDATRIGTGDDRTSGGPRTPRDPARGWAMGESGERPDGGRWPANVVLDETTAPLLDQQSGTLKSGGYPAEGGQRSQVATFGKPNSRGEAKFGASEGGASRFFKVAKSDEHGAISEHFPREFDAPFMYVAKAPKKERPVVDGVAHPTVKPLALMRWLIRLVTPEGGVVLDPFEGSGTTLEACLLEGFNHVGIEREADYLPLIMSRVDRQAGTLPAAA